MCIKYVRSKLASILVHGWTHSMTSTRPYLAAFNQKNRSWFLPVPSSSKYFWTQETEEVTLSPVVILFEYWFSSLALRNILQAKGPCLKCPLPPSIWRDIPMTSSASWWIVVLVDVMLFPWFCCKSSRLLLRGGDSESSIVVLWWSAGRVLLS